MAGDLELVDELLALGGDEGQVPELVLEVRHVVHHILRRALDGGMEEGGEMGGGADYTEGNH